MKRSAVVLALGVLFGGSRAGAAVKWEAGPKLELGWSTRTVALADGRWLTCLERAEQCERVDPMTGAREAVPIAYRDGLLSSAVALDDGNLLSPYERSLLELPSGALRPLPAGPALGEFRGVAISGARAAFVSRQRCDRVLFYLGMEKGFRDVTVAPPGVCLHDVFDLGDDRVLISRTMKSTQYQGDNDQDFLQLNLRDFSFQTGPRMRFSDPMTAFRHRGEIVVLMRSRWIHGKTEVLFLDRDMKQQRRLTFPEEELRALAMRVDDDRVLLFDAMGSLLWDLTRGRVARVAFPASAGSSLRLTRDTSGVVVLNLDSQRGFRLAGAVRSVQASCDHAQKYARGLATTQDGAEFDHNRAEMLGSTSDGAACRDYADERRRFPDDIQVPLDALLRRSQGTASPEEQVAARVLCTLVPNFGGPLITRIDRAGRLDEPSATICRQAERLHPVLVAAETKAAADALLEYGLHEQAGQVRVRHGAVVLLEWRRDLARDAGPLLREAERERAIGFEQLRTTLCWSNPTGDLAKACNAVAPEQEKEKKRKNSRENPKRPRILLNLGIATGVIGGLTTLAYFGRENDAGRAVAIGSAIIGGAGAGALGTLALSKGGGDTSGLGTLLLAVPITIGGAVAGGVISTYTSREPGYGRFATAAVPLSAAALSSVGLAIDAW